MPRSRPARRLRAGVTSLLTLSLVLASLLSAGPVGANDAIGPDEEVALEVFVRDRVHLDELIGLGVDIDHSVEPLADGRLVVSAIVTQAEAADIRAHGFDTGRITWRSSRSAEILAEQEELQAEKWAEVDAVIDELRSLALTSTDPDPVVIMRADYYTSGTTSKVLYVEARSELGGVTSPNTQLQVCRDSGPGTPISDPVFPTPPAGSGCTNLSRFTDGGQYMYHQAAISVASLATPPSLVRVTSSVGGSAEKAVEEWLPIDGEPPVPEDYRTDFVPGYMNPTELYAAYDALAAEFPDLVEVIELPNKTDGYRRPAMATLYGGNPGGSVGGGTNQARAVVVRSVAWGHEGGNDITVALVDPGAAFSPLSVTVTGNAISVSLATDGSGARVSTAAQVVAALNASSEASSLVHAHTYRNNAGAGVVQPQSATSLSDYLSAPAEISREPFTVKAYRLGKDPNGSKIGVLAYAQEHAREWVPPMVALESATRLLRNYQDHGPTKQLLNKLEIFFIPSLNPDGGHYSFFDSGGQRRTMTNHCADNLSDPGARNAWGVDTNRNYDYGSLFDGYSGASTNCTSDVFAGPAELSEPENRNLVHLVESFPNIKFSMNLHSSGNYFMWSPGAYSLPGRITLARPAVGDEAYFWAASNRILTEIKRYRNLAVTPARTGPIADVLYSAAGNSGDRLWYVNDIYAWNFEVGGAGFQPSPAEAHDQTMEFANGLMELMRVAYDFGKDHDRPVTTAALTTNDDGTVTLAFTRSEPATIFYTTDGSRPTFASPQIGSAGIRQLDETLSFTVDTTVNWFSIDSAGNIENNYNPNGSKKNYNRVFVDVP